MKIGESIDLLRKVGRLPRSERFLKTCNLVGSRIDSPNFWHNPRSEPQNFLALPCIDYQNPGSPRSHLVEHMFDSLLHI